MNNHLRLLMVLTGLFVFFQVAVLGIDLYLSKMGVVFSTQILKELFSSPSFQASFLRLILAQFFIYTLYVYFLWYMVCSLADLFQFKKITSLLLCFFIWFDSVIVLLCLNLYFVPHSQITVLIRKYFFNESPIDFSIKFTLILSAIILIFAALLCMFKLMLDIWNKHFHLKQKVFSLIIVSLSLFLILPVFFNHTVPMTGATEKTPNIIIVGFDALRPDYLSFFNKTPFSTPHFDTFLKKAIVFKEAYTPIARTTPSWAALLTGRYPIKIKVRENNEYIDPVNIPYTLGKSLKQIGYETFYATDDRRHNQIDNNFGFDHVIGPDGRLSDFLIGSLNDFPLSNLIAPTFWGKLLFPYNHANHGSYYTFQSSDFLSNLRTQLNKDYAKPIFLAVHFNVSGWPFGWFNDKLPYNVVSYNAYQAGVLASDILFNEFMNMLAEKKLLGYALVVLVSDHGIALGLPNDRVVNDKNYRGKNKKSPLLRTKYAEKKEISFAEELTHSLNSKNYGVDTAYGYGSDVLSLKQTAILLAFKSFGFTLGVPHQVSGRALSLDIMPTILSMLALPLSPDIDGKSLISYIYNSNLQLDKNRAIYIENAYSPDEIILPQIDKNEVVKHNLDYFKVNFNTGEIFLSPYWAKFIVANKQRMILQGDWLLACYPPSKKLNFVGSKKGKNQLELRAYRFPPYFVLVNLKTGEWTNDMSQSMVKNSRFPELYKNLWQFYGNEMKICGVKGKKIFSS